MVGSAVKQKLVTVDTAIRFRGAEAYVYNDEDDPDPTIFITGDLKYWAEKEVHHDWIDIMTSIISHETLHNVLLRICSNQTSAALDNLFGHGEAYSEEKDGLMKFDQHFKPTPKSRRIKGWKR